jgi:ABC-2 type transport system ATP-binding protein
MSSDQTVVRLDGVDLCYRLAKQKIPSLKEYAIRWIKGSLKYEELWALKDVSLSVRAGESVGVIGRNGAGKSTLLKIISRVLRPTHGSAVIDGVLAPILELGAGFDSELTGEENIYLNALLLGRTRREIDAKRDEIVEFSELGDFIRSPIRNYSSGMVARLGFSVATAWTPDILVLDEVLRVGDSQFVRRCEQRIENFREEGTTIVLVSHDAKAVREICTRVIWLDQGEIRARGPVDEIVDRYLEFSGAA